MAAANNNQQVVLNLTDNLNKPNQRTGRISLLSNAYPTPPGVADDFWNRLVKTADKQVRRINSEQAPQQLDAWKFRKAYLRLLVHLRTASATGTPKQRAIFQTRVNLQEDFFGWVTSYGRKINRTTWNNGPSPT